MHPATKKPPLQGPRSALPTLPDATLERGEVYQCDDEDLAFYLAWPAGGAQAWRPYGGGSSAPTRNDLALPGGSGTLAITAEDLADLVFLGGGGLNANVTIELPDPAALPGQRRVTLAWHSLLTLHFTATNGTVGGQASQAFNTVQANAVTLQADPATSDWTQVATYAPPGG
jgi:hypothetical protein